MAFSSFLHPGAASSLFYIHDFLAIFNDQDILKIILTLLTNIVSYYWCWVLLIKVILTLLMNMVFLLVVVSFLDAIAVTPVSGWVSGSVGQWVSGSVIDSFRLEFSYRISQLCELVHIFK